MGAFYHFVPLPIFGYGTYGVLLFFIISGYCISFSAETSRSAWHFYSKRLGRLLPALFVCGLATTAFKHYSPELTDADRMLSWWNFVYTLFSLPTLDVLRIDNRFPDGAYWSLVVEFRYYFIYFAIMAIGLRAHVLPLLCVFVVFRTLTTDQSQATSNDFFPFFIAGMGVAAIVEGRLREASAAIFVAFLVEFYHLHFGFAQPSVPMITSRSLLLCAGTAAMYFAATYRPSPQMESLLRPLSFIGLISYPLYLIHQDVGNMILRWASVDTAVTSASLLMRLLLIAGMMALASLVYFVFERRSTKVITDLLATPAAWNSKRKIPAGPPERECQAGLVNFGPQRDHIGC